LVDVLNTNSKNKEKDGWYKQRERGRVNQSLLQKNQRAEVENNLHMVQYSTISGVSKESVGNNIITNFQHALGLSKARLTQVIRNFIVNGVVTNRKEREDKESSVFT